MVYYFLNTIYEKCMKSLLHCGTKYDKMAHVCQCISKGTIYVFL